MSKASLKSVSASFSSAAARVTGKDKRPSPVSIRFSAEEQALLLEWADGRPISTTIRQRLFGSNAKKGRRLRPPPRQQKAIADALRRLGHSVIAAYLVNQIVAVEEGRLHLSVDEERQLREARAECYAIRKDLMIALGVDAESECA